MKFNIQLPEDVKLILNRLNAAGYEAYVVGGCVRDSILEREPHDWDICTSANPKQIMKVFKSYVTIPTGMKYGTITVGVNSSYYEVTTFRVDGQYTDSRRPDAVKFTRSIDEDLSRRDFTINAMAYHPVVGLVDPYNGLEDIRNKVIRCVNDPTQRFQEDGLRILRAIRFATRLNFKLSSSTGFVATALSELLHNISCERIISEINQMIICPNFSEYFVKYHDIFTAIIPELSLAVYFHQRNPYHCYDVYMHTAEAICEAPQDLITRLALLFHDISKPYTQVVDAQGIGHYYGHAQKSAEMADEIMRRLRYDNHTRHNVVELVKYHDSTISPTPKSVRKWLNKLYPTQLSRLLDMRQADILAQSSGVVTERRLSQLSEVRAIMNTVMNENQCICIKDLAVNGYDLMEIGYEPGKVLGSTLKRLLDCVIADEVDNNKADLMRIAATWL